MCKNCGNIEHDGILKPKEGEQFSINANNLTKKDISTINNFITFGRNLVQLKQSPTLENFKSFKKSHEKLIGKKSGTGAKRK